MEYYSVAILYVGLFTGIFFQVFLLLTFLYDGPKKRDLKLELKSNRKNVFAGELPSVAIIVPCYNEEKTLAKTMWSISDLKYPKNKLSITVVDDGSKDNTYRKALITKERILSKVKYKGIDIQVYRQENGGKFTAMNFAIEKSKADLVGCLDADSTVHDEALLRMIEHFKDQNVGAVVPAITVYKPENYLQKIQKIEYNMGILSRYVFGRLNALHVTPGPFSIFRKNVFEKIGPFRHAHNTEDMEIAMRLQIAKYKIANCEDAFVYTITPNTLKKLVIQRTRWTYGFLRNALDYKDKIFNPKLGHFSTFTMPLATISILVIAGLAINVIYNFTTYITNSYQKFKVVGVDWYIFDNFSFDLDLFMLNTGTLWITTLLSIAISLYFIFKSQKLVDGYYKPSVYIFYYIALYIFICPVWIGKALFNTALAKKVPWR